MKILMGIGDIHLRDKPFYKKGLNNFLEWFDSKIPDNKRDCTEIILTGDIFDKISLYPETSALAIKFFKTLHKKASTVYSILGNHDYGLTQYHIKNTTPFLKKLNVQVIEEPCTITTNLGFKLLCLPWAYNFTHAKMNDYIKKNCDQQYYDACISHWEIDSLFGSSCIELNNVQSKVFYCGHIHSHATNPYYLGSILPNNISEIKTEDFSVLRMLVQKDDNNCITKDLPIPSFISIKSTHIHSLTDLENIQNQDSTIFFKIYYDPAISLNDIENKSKVLGLQVYSIEPEGKEEIEIPSLQEDFLLNKEVYIPKSHTDLLQRYAKQFKLSEKEFELAQKLITEVEV